jgi:hypothetical protein
MESKNRKLRVGDRVKIADRHLVTQSVKDLNLIGTVVHTNSVSAAVGFSLTTEQFRIISQNWRNEGSPCAQEFQSLNIEQGKWCRSWIFPDNDLILADRHLTDEEQNLLTELKAKKDRSPVDDFILFGLES